VHPLQPQPEPPPALPAWTFNPRRSRLSLHLLLFGSTFLTTLVAGAIFHADSGTADWRRLLNHPKLWMAGLPYAVSVLLILLAHEMGHYLACVRYRIDATLPFFLPGIPILGTFGAFIRIRSRITHRAALFDIGIAGPLAGFAVAIPIFLYGMSRSRVIPLSEAGPTEYFLGFPLMFNLAMPLFFPVVPDGSALSLSPYLSAAWVGMLATSLNLLPAGQLDGGHICYAVSRRFHARMSRLTLVAVILLGALYRAWLVWAVALLFLGDRHPPLLDESEPLSRGRRVLAAVALVIFILSFMPIPVQFPS
jgi:membrane-associated protease RseP (regulator of RpoE activity)